MSLRNLATTSFEKRAPKGGPASSEHYNFTIGSIVSDLSRLSEEWNNKLKPLLNSLPGGRETLQGNSPTPDAFINGLDGSNLYVDSHASERIDDGLFYSLENRRPITIKESVISLFTRLNDDFSELKAEIQSVLGQGGALTTRQKNLIGASIFFDNATSSAISLEGRVTTAENILLESGNTLYNIGLESQTKTSLGYFMATDNSGVSGSEASTITAITNNTAVFLWDAAGNKIAFLENKIELWTKLGSGDPKKVFYTSSATPGAGFFTHEEAGGYPYIKVTASGSAPDKISVNCTIPVI